MEPIEYTRVKNGVRYWEPSKKLRALGFKAKHWPESAEGREKARQETAKAKKAVETREAPPTYVAGSLAHFWHHFRARLWERVEHGEIKPRTAMEYDTAWLRIEPRFGDTTITDIGPDDVTDFKRELDRDFSPSTRRRAIAKLREILQDAVRRKVIPVDPTSHIRNTAPKGRKAFFSPDEIAAQVESAKLLGMDGMALCIRLMYETARSPVDARLLNSAALRMSPDGPYIDRSREKTGVDGFQAISQSLYDDILAYIDGLGVSLHPDAPIFRRHASKNARRRKAEPWKSPTDFSTDFAEVRKHALGPEDTRKAMDIRRTANLEAALGGASPEDRAALLANSLDRNQTLDAIYTPPTLEAARRANRARATGRSLIASSLSRNAVV
ncbi:hypothetical protein D1227_06180 [Henriciella mobilis]|uniref:hypothetical protein n=1 Tax=Henriciella mobilis TaxID=2305467 RepID=UPI000E675270|nr:hypothetical protein [Henriciella mobilis]RIJ16000.1 hypothetical protein D1231_09415 [Henriciella mobilis]RIJ21211.1 hypothetical protein D1227_12960 [Henriciella mobilis]RIJ23088.1 hypothetical protein D1227_06180 [Henriciella mobilis]